MVIEDKATLHQAIVYAAEYHQGKKWNSFGYDYITHPMEVMQILTKMGADDDLLMAGLLHGIPENEDQLEELECDFGEEAAAIIGYTARDPEKTWRENKESWIEVLEFVPKEVKMLFLADITADLRSIVAEEERNYNDVWKMFAAPKEDLAWYYGSMKEGLKELQNYENTAPFYWEMLDLYTEMFVDHWYDEDNKTLYRVEAINTMKLSYKQPEWVDAEELPEDPEQIGMEFTLPEDAREMEADWIKKFIRRIHKKDMADGIYPLFRKTSKKLTRTITAAIAEGKIQLHCEDIEKNPEGNPDENKFFYELRKKESDTMFKMLRTQYGATYTFEEILKDSFGSYEGPLKFKALCEAYGLDYIYCSNRRDDE